MSTLRWSLTCFMLSLVSAALTGCGAEAVPSEAQGTRPASVGEPHSLLGSQQFFTRGLWEPDKLASAWLLKQHVAPGSAVLMLHGEDPAPTGAVAFDLPGARWAREGMLSTFEVIVRDEGLDDPVLQRIGRLVRASELSSWMLEPGTQEERFDRAMKELALAEDPAETFAWLDRLHAGGGDLDKAPPPSLGGPLIEGPLIGGPEAR